MSHRPFAPVLLAFLLVVSARADVRDEARRFDADAVKKANEAITKIKQDFRKDVIIETLPEIPADRKAKLDPAKRAEFFRIWADERAKALSLDGIYIQIVRQPGHLEVSVDAKTEKKAFTRANRDKLADVMLTQFRKNQFDEGLRDGVDFIRKTLEENLKDEPQGDLARKLRGVKVELYAPAPGYSEGPTWRDGNLYFCSGALLRVDREKKVTKYLDINPAGTFLCGDGHILVCDNKVPALLDISPEGKVGVLVEQFQGKKLNSLNDVTVDKDGNIYWTDPSGSTRENPTGSIFRVTPEGKVDRIADNLAFPNGLDVDPGNKYLYVIESQTAKVLRYDLPAAGQPLGMPVVFYALGGSGGDGCVFDADGNLWVADFHRQDTKHGRITVLSPAGKALAYLDVPAKVVSNITFGGIDHDEIFMTTGEPAGVFHAKVGMRGFRGHPATKRKVLRDLDIKPLSDPVPNK